MSREQKICYNCGCPTSDWILAEAMKPIHWSDRDCINALKTRISNIESTMRLLEKNDSARPGE